MIGKLDPEERILDDVLPEPPKWFSQTSDEPYDRHHYRFVYSDGQSKIFESYERAQQEWFNLPTVFKSHIEVLDIKNKKQKNLKGGFKQ
jgi:hypothetical protein